MISNKYNLPENEKKLRAEPDRYYYSWPGACFSWFIILIVGTYLVDLLGYVNAGRYDLFSTSLTLRDDPDLNMDLANKDTYNFLPSFELNFIDKFQHVCDLKDKNGKLIDIFDFTKTNIYPAYLPLFRISST